MPPWEPTVSPLDVPSVREIVLAPRRTKKPNKLLPLSRVATAESGAISDRPSVVPLLCCRLVPCDEPLTPGQKVELGIAEGSLLGSAMLVYMSPLAGLFLFAALFQVLFGSDLAALSGAVLGGVGGFLIARGYSRKLAEREAWQPVILNVALPPDLIRVETQQ